ncbi:interferon-induced very large GTPase 1-like [Mytilus trossulus]|uniref:interferon-induced very large GTPase 1-like n=1 Tax=Mytilus trossulus TaxID=6551 RepID=UPI0030045C8E
MGDLSDDDDDDDEDNSFEEANPLDIVLATFLCCSPILKQLITTKMSWCRLATPFIYQSTEQGLKCLIWPYRALTNQGINNDGIKYEDALVDQPNKIVTCLRFGNSSISKSEIINKVLSEKYHNTFYHRNCQMGNSPRILSNGSVEISWYFPSGKKDEVFSDTLAFLNLRGDAFVEASLSNILMQVASLIVAFMDSRVLENKDQMNNIFQSIHKKKIPIIFCLDATFHAHRDVEKTLREYVLNANVGGTLLKIMTIKSRETHESEANMMQRFRVVISYLLKLKEHGKSLIQCIQLFKELGIKNDEEIEPFVQVNRKTNVIMEKIGDKPKNKILPLQAKLWTEWSSMQKAYNRVGTNTQYKDKNRIQREMSDLRVQQIQILNNLSPVMQDIISYLNEMIESKQNNCLIYFFYYLQQKLDCHSRKVIPKYSNEYQCHWNKWKAAVESNETGRIEKLRSVVDGAEMNLSQSYFGLEHVIREFGQMYETISENDEDKTPTNFLSIRKFPEIVAQLIHQGFPFEIMDGDASNVPISWITDVFLNLQNLIGKRKLLTISILGLQSSGKSTLLNCMFGLEFPVRAGRCTRGVFMRLLPVPTEDYFFDYILVVDTEGLRAPELGMLKYDHDNKLATFVIGIGDITIINIKGENTSEVQDVLQIAVHAFMKLVLVNNNIKLKQSCIFVHQNVSLQDAKGKLVHATLKTVETLDTMTRQAADQLDIVNIKTFNQVIQFDGQKDVWYLPDLWYGDPPMAPSNPGYSRRVEELRCKILLDKTKTASILNLPETCQRIKDLWKGILSEDFIFSFRNSLEVKAYIKVERKFQNLSSQIRAFVFRYPQTVIKGKLAICCTEQELESICHEYKQTLREQVECELEDRKKDLEIFFDNNTLQNIVGKWKSTTIMKLTNMTEECIHNTAKDVDRKKENYKLILLNASSMEKDEKEINQRIKALIQRMKGKRLQEDELKRQFNSMMQDWIERHKPRLEKNELSLNDQLQAVMMDRLGTIGSFLKEVNIKQDISYGSMKSLINSIQLENIHEKYISIPNVLRQNFFIFKKNNFKTCAKRTLDITNKIFLKSDRAVAKRIKLDERFNSIFITELLDIIMNEIDKFNSCENDAFNILDTYRAMLAVHVCNYAKEVYGKMNERYERKHGWEAKVKVFKKNMWEIFYNSVLEKEKEYIAASLFKNVVLDVAIKHISEIMTEDIIHFLRGEIGSSKHALMTMVLDKLADEGSFESIMSYMQCTEDFAHKWLVNFAESKLFEKTCSDQNEYCKIAYTHIQNIIGCVTDSIIFATENSKSRNLNIWIKHFTKKVNTSLPLSVLSFRQITVEFPDSDIKDFSDFLKREIETLEQIMITKFRSKTRKNIVWSSENPIDTFFVEAWGCNKHCPFCYEPCQFTSKDHIDVTPHKCLQHRISGLTGTFFKQTNYLNIEICNSSVMTTQNCIRRFSCNACKNECKKSGKCEVTDPNGYKQWHHFSDYKKYFPDWDIAPDNTLSVSNYWAWVAATFKDRIIEKFGRKLPEMPDSWTNITKQQAKDSLRKQF